MTASAAETVWARGRLDARGRRKKVLFGRMHEDVSIEIGAFPPEGRVFCIASAGCTPIALSARHEVVAADINPVQLDYARRRISGARSRRGSAERFMALARTLSPLAGWRPSLVERFLDLGDPAEQAEFWRRHLDTRRFRAALDLLLSRPVLRTVYSARYLEVLPPRFGRVLRARIARCISRHPNRTNRYARDLLLGDASDAPAPSEARKIRLVPGDAAECLEQEPAGSFDGFTLSNILDGAEPGYARRLLVAVKRAASPGAVVVLRSFREPREALTTNRAGEDRSMLWGVVDVRPAASL